MTGILPLFIKVLLKGSNINGKNLTKFFLNTYFIKISVVSHPGELAAACS